MIAGKHEHLALKVNSHFLFPSHSLFPVLLPSLFIFVLQNSLGAVFQCVRSKELGKNVLIISCNVV